MLITAEPQLSGLIGTRRNIPDNPKKKNPNDNKNCLIYNKATFYHEKTLANHFENNNMVYFWLIFNSL